MSFQLTERETQILKLIANGFTNKYIACHLQIKESTVENHIHHIYKKLELNNRSQATFVFGSQCQAIVAGLSPLGVGPGRPAAHP